MVIPLRDNRIHYVPYMAVMGRTRIAVGNWIALRNLGAHDYLFPSRKNLNAHITTRQYSKLLKEWVADIGLDPKNYGTHSLRRTKATLIYRRTKNLRAVARDRSLSNNGSSW